MTSAPTNFSNSIVSSKTPALVQASGTYFYLTVASGPLFIKVGGSWVLYYSGMGTNVPGGFSTLQIYNPTPNAVTYQIVSGTGKFIDKRQIYNTAAPNVAKIASWTGTGGSGYVAQLPDISGQTFQDVLGNTWIAVQRVSIIIQALQTAALNVLIAGNYGSESGNTTVAETSFGQAPIILNCSGNFYCNSVAGSSGSVSLATTEIYQAITPNSTSYEPPN